MEAGDVENSTVVCLLPGSVLRVEGRTREKRSLRWVSGQESSEQTIQAEPHVTANHVRLLPVPPCNQAFAVGSDPGGFRADDL